MLAICRYHRNSNGWNDIGYQALVDKYGALYEGRAGGLDQAVLGAQAQGFNAADHRHREHRRQQPVGRPTRRSTPLADYIRWKLTLHGQPLSGAVTLTSAGGVREPLPGRRARARRPRVLGHRDTGKHRLPGRRRSTPSSTTCAPAWSTGEPVRHASRTRLTAALADAHVRYGGRCP